MKLNLISVRSKKNARKANITIEKKTIAEKNEYRIGDALILPLRFRVISVRSKLLVSHMMCPAPLN